MEEEWEGYKLFTRTSLQELRERQRRLRTRQATEKYSGAKQCILKGDELLIPQRYSFFLYLKLHIIEFILELFVCFVKTLIHKITSN